MIYTFTDILQQDPLLVKIIPQGWGQLHINVINYNYMKICQLQLKF